MNPYSALEDSSEYLEPTNVEFFKFTGLVPDAKIALQQQPFDISKYPASVSLIAVSNKHGYVAAATNEGFVFDSTKLFRKAFYSANTGETINLTEGKISVPLNHAIRQIRFTAEESQILIATEGGKLLVYNVDDIHNNKEKASPIQCFELQQDIIDLRPNPEALPHLAAVLFNNHQCKIINITNGATECDLPIADISAICWSPKGKQIVCGKLDGTLQHFDSAGAVKSELGIPKLMSVEGGVETENRYVKDVLWIENHIFLALYCRKRQSEEDDFVHDGYIINRKPANGSNTPEYIRLAEITPIFSNEGRGNHFYMEIIRNLGKEIKHLIIIANSATGDLSVVGQNENGEWATWSLPENGEANLPLSNETSMDTYPLGLAIDFTADEKLPPLDASEDETGINPMPIFYFINDEGHVGAYHCYNVEIARRNEPYSVITSYNSAPATTQVKQEAVPAQTSAFGSAMTNTTGSFGDLLSGKAETSPTAPSNGFGSFGGSIPSFSNLGSAQKIPAAPNAGFTSPKFQKDTPAPSFGSTTNIGFATNKPTTVAAVDKPLSSFGAVKTETNTTSAFNASTAAPAFGSTSTVGGFGSLALNKVPGATNPTTTTSAFKTSSNTSTSSFANSAFTSSSAVTVIADSSNNKAPATSGFGSLAKNTVPGAAAPSFGSTSTLGGGGFGSLAKNTVPGATAPAFGATNTLGSGGFGSLAKNTVPGATTPSFGSTNTLGSGGFGSLAKNTVPGATVPTNKPLFGAPSTLGNSTFGSSTTADTTTKSIPTSSATTESKGKAPEVTPKASTTPTITPAVSKPSVTSPSTLKTQSTPVESKSKSSESSSKQEMGEQFEYVYNKISEGIEGLQLINERNSKAISDNSVSSEPKSLASLGDKNSVWNLNDVAGTGALAQNMIDSIEKDQARNIEMFNSVKALTSSCLKSVDKAEDIKHLLHPKKSSDIVNILDERELDSEAKDVLNAVENKSEACDSRLSNLEFKMQEYKKSDKVKNDRNPGNITLYSLHRDIRDIQANILGRASEVTELEDKVAELKLIDSRRKAKTSSRGFGCDNISDREDKDEISTIAIENTTRYFRRINFLANVCEKVSSRPPLQNNVE